MNFTNERTSLPFGLYHFTTYNLRNNLIKDGVIVDRVFTRDYEFNAPSATSAVILGHTSNGNVNCKTAEGTKLKDL